MSEDIRLAPSMKTARRCACRGWIIATPHPNSVAKAVVEHQESEPHKSWDRTAWINANTVETVVRVVATRKVAA